MSSVALDADGPIAEFQDDAEERLTTEIQRRGWKFTDAERLNKKITIARMMLRGATRNEIAEAAEVHPNTVTYFAKAIEAEWRMEAVKHISDIKAKELAKLDQLEATAWDAWERSKLPIKKQNLKTELVPAIQKGHEPERLPREARQTQEERVGDPKYLDIIFKCIDKRMKVLGVSESPAVPEGPLGGTAIEFADRVSKYRHILATPAIVLTPGTFDHDGAGESLDSGRPPREASGVPDIIDI